jgi:hypothetical protein
VVEMDLGPSLSHRACEGGFCAFREVEMIFFEQPDMVVEPTGRKGCVWSVHPVCRGRARTGLSGGHGTGASGQA